MAGEEEFSPQPRALTRRRGTDPCAGRNVYDRLAAAGDDNPLALQSAVDQFRELVLRLGDSMSAHDRKIAIAWLSG